MRGGGGFEGDDLSPVASGSALVGELAGVGADVEEQVDRKLGKEKTVAQLLRAVDISFSDLMTGGFH